MKRVLGVALLCLVIALSADAAGRKKKKKEKKKEGKEEAVVQVDANEILEKADEATKAATLFSYEVRYEPTGWLETQAQFTTSEGKVTLVGDDKGEPAKFRIEVSVTSMYSRAPREYLACCDGENYWLVDHRNKQWQKGTDKSKVLRGHDRDIMSTIMNELVGLEPFSDEMSAEKAEVKGVEKVGDVECHRIHVTYAGGTAEAVWYFGKEDYLPRQVDRVFRDQKGEEGALRLTLTNLVVEPELDEEAFKVERPKGYRKGGGSLIG
jgi:hypothetical protein